MACFLPYREETGADMLARQFLKDIFANHRLPQSIVSNRGSIFAAKFTKVLYKALDIKRNLSTAFYPQTDGVKAHQSDVRTVLLYVLQPLPDQLGRLSPNGFVCIQQRDTS